MADLAVDTTVEPNGNGGYAATVSREWRIWGPSGGYLSAIALRAAGESTKLGSPACLYCRYLSRPRFGGVELQVTRLATSRRTESLRVTMTQSNRPVLEAVVTSVAAMPGPQRAWTAPPDLPPPAELRSLEQQALEVGRPLVPFWKNVEVRTVERREAAAEPELLAWQRFRPTATFEDFWLDACRAVILVDTTQFPAASRGFEKAELTFMAPSLDMYVAFHGSARDQEWLVTATRGVSAHGGLLGGRATVWSADGRLVATGAQQMLVADGRRPW